MLNKYKISFFLLTILLSFQSIAELPVPPKGVRYYQIGAAKNFTLADIDGEKINLTENNGKWTFLHFWASWCGPCKKEMPTINKMASIINSSSSSSSLNKKLNIVIVNTAEDEDTIFSFLAEIAMEMPVYMDRDGLITEHWKPRGLPTTFLIDKKGFVRYQAIGGREWHQPTYVNFLNQLINEH